MKPAQTEGDAAAITRLPVTILCGFLGAGKTTLLNALLRQRPEERWFVVENEFGAVSIDDQLLQTDVQQWPAELMTIRAGCLCCQVQGDFRVALTRLATRLRNSGAVFDRVVIEASGLAEPAGIAEALVGDPEVEASFCLDAVITVVDALHAAKTLAEQPLAATQVAFADRIVLSKLEGVDDAALDALRQRLRALNPRAALLEATRTGVPADALLDLAAFDVQTALQIAPDFLDAQRQHQHPEVDVLLLRAKQALDPLRFDAWMGHALQAFGDDLLRYKGLLRFRGSPRQWVVQGVHHRVETEAFHRLESGAEDSVLVILGRKLPLPWFEFGFAACAIR